MSHGLKKCIEDKKLENKKEKKFAIDKLGKHKKERHQLKEQMNVIELEKENIRNEKDKLVIENNALKTKGVELSSNLETTKSNVKEAEKEISLMKKRNVCDVKVNEDVLKSKMEKIESLETEA